jgi:hypothetical protein
MLAAGNAVNDTTKKGGESVGIKKNEADGTTK